MTILHIETLNKRDQRIHLDSGAVVELTVENMHEVAMYLQHEEVGRLHFEALSSLNNIDIGPLYQLRAVSLHHAAVDADVKALNRAGIALFKAYTNGRIKYAKPP
jgi:hypothetical protein